jgi:putative hydrolase of the HAD superfamily
MNIRNVVFDVGRGAARMESAAHHCRPLSGSGHQAVIREQIFEHADWHEFDRGTLSEAAAIEHFAKLSGRTRDETRLLMQAARESLAPITGTIALVEELADAGLHLYLLSNMPVSTFEYLIEKPQVLRALRAPGDLRRHPAGEARARDLQTPGGREPASCPARACSSTIC